MEATTIQYVNNAPKKIRSMSASGGYNDGWPTSVHIEKMTDHDYWARIGDKEFHFFSAASYGPGIEIKKVRSAKGVVVTPLKNDPDIVDEIVANGKDYQNRSLVTVVLLSKHVYKLEVRDAEFIIKSAKSKGPGIMVMSGADYSNWREL